MISDLKIKIFNKIEEVPSSDWEKVYPNVLESYDFLKALDESMFLEFSFFYILVYENDLPIAATTSFMMNFPLDLATEGFLSKILSLLKRVIPSILNPRVLICGLPMAQGRIGILKRPQDSIEAIEQAMNQMAKKYNVSIMGFKDFNAADKVILDKFLSKSFFTLESLPNTEMKISYKNFDDYLKSLSAVSRSGIKRKLKKLETKAKIDLEITNKLDDLTLTKVHALYLQTYDKNEMSLEKLTPDFFLKIAQYMPEESKFFLWKIDNKLVAFAFCLARGDYFIDYYLGFDYDFAYEYHLYDVRFRDLMNWCIEHKIKTYEMGQTSYESKRRLGFSFIRLYLFAKHRNRIINLFFRLFCLVAQPSNFDPVFKKMHKKVVLDN